MMERVGDREKWKSIVGQAKAHSGKYCQWMKKISTLLIQLYAAEFYPLISSI
jgi:hypothetical protein